MKNAKLHHPAFGRCKDCTTPLGFAESTIFGDQCHHCYHAGPENTPSVDNDEVVTYDDLLDDHHQALLGDIYGEK